MDLERLNQKMSGVAVLNPELVDPDLNIDASLLSSVQNERRLSFLNMCASAMQFMPITRKLISEICEDFYIMKSEGLFWYIFEGRCDGETFFYRSGVPKKDRAHLGNVDIFYSTFDGFCDLNMQGGLLPIHSTRQLGMDGYTYNEEPSRTISRSLIGKSLHVFNSGGKGQGYLDLQSLSLLKPVGHVLWLDDDEPLIGVDFWNLVDSWTEIAIQ